MNREQMVDVATKAVVAAAFFFVLQYVILKASLDTSLFWAIALGGGAGLLAWSQQTRS
jgi:hypothetical protein